MNHYQVNTRIWELDLLRGLAVLLMVVFHFIFNLNEFYQVPVGYQDNLVYYTGKLAALLFIMVSGISCVLSNNNFKRGLVLIVLAFILTAVTSLMLPGSNIIFGILHFLGISILLYLFFQSFRPVTLLILGTFIIAAGPHMAFIEMPNNLLAPLGLYSGDFYSLDYYPLIPWFGFFLYGVAFGKIKYSKKKSLFKFTVNDNLLTYLGKRSLPIYLLHQPVLIALIYVVFYTAAILGQQAGFSFPAPQLPF